MVKQPEAKLSVRMAGPDEPGPPLARDGQRQGSSRAPVLLLNQNYEPLNICPVRRAMVLLCKGNAEMLENGMGYLHTAAEVFELPSVIRLFYQVRRPLPIRRLTRREVFIRDRHCCQYCALYTRDLTIDHVVPRVRGGRHEWENVVAACKRCNHRKAGRSPKEAGMRLLAVPCKPRSTPFDPFVPYLDQRAEWRKFVPTV